KVGNSLYVSIPRGWIESRRLAPGSVLAIEVVEEGLLLKPVEKAFPDVRVKQIVGGSGRDIIKAYLEGYEVIEIEQPSDKLLKKMDNLLNLLVGLEVVEEGPDRLVLQCFISEGYDVKGVLSRMDAISRSMYVDAAAALEAGDEETLKLVRARDDRLDRLYFLTVRLIRSTIRSPEASDQERLFMVDARLFAKLLEEIGDEAERMTYLQPSEGLLDTAKIIAKYQKRSVEAFLNRSMRPEATNALEDLNIMFSDAPAFRSLLKIAKLVWDLTELI
ncbi:MAG: phosphate uptake regulator PhoU, partial [Thermofilum sp.]|uniref:phosphate uptake regulator PhoU n=1 Tax=Thermofilum sp. TaxID=1961369 RepID=UPI0031685A17